MTSSQEIVNKQILVNQNLINLNQLPPTHKTMSSDFTPKQSFHSFVGVALDIGGRDHMEDEFNVVLNKDLSYFGVYDGHAGSLASSFVRDNLSKHFFSKGVNSMKNKSSLQSAMTKAHVDVDKEYFVMEQQARKDGTHCSYSGSTSISFVFKQREGWGFVANAGDCRAILFHKGKVVNLSTDHRILRTGVSSPETQRVIDLGGWIEDGLLCGQLEPTRGFGDCDFKQLKNVKFPGSEFKGDLVTPVPEYEWFSLTDEPDVIIESTNCTNEITVGVQSDHYSFLVLASDGVWDMVRNCDVLQNVSENLKLKKPLNGNTIQSATNDLMNLVRQKAQKKKISMDNTTIILIAFAPCEDPGHYEESDSSCLFCFEQSISQHTQNVINSKAAAIAKTKTKKKQRNQRRKKRQKNKK